MDCHNKMNPSLKYLQNLLKEHNLRGYSHFDTKPELIELLTSKGLLQITPDVPKPPKPAIDSKRRNPECIRRPPKSVKMINNETGEITIFPSMYKCSKALKVNTGLIKFYNNRTLAGHTISVVES